MDAFTQDLRFALRLLLKRRGFAAMAILTLALGISACTIMFSVVYGTMLRPLPFDADNQLVYMQGKYPSTSWFDSHCSYPSYRDLQAQSTTLENLAAYEIQGLNFTEGDRPRRITAIRATASIFQVLGALPMLGRPFDAEEDRPGGDHVVVLNEGFWRSHFNADPEVVGRDVTIHNETYTVIGVLPREFERHWVNSHVWFPLAAGTETTSRHDNNLRLLGRRAPNADMVQVNTELDAIMSRIEQAYPLLNGGRAIRARTIHESWLAADQNLALKSLAAAVALVLLIACGNVANLMLVRAASREREMALRVALGAGRGRIVRQLLIESMVIALLAGVAGVLAAIWGVEIVSKSLSDGPLGKSTIEVDGLALGFALLTSLATAALFGLAPALRASHPDIVDALKDGSRSSGLYRRRRMRNGLVVGEIALAVVLVAATGLIIQSTLRLQQVDPGFNPRDLLTMRVTLPEYAYAQPHRQRAFYADLLAELERIPEVTSAVAVNAPPFMSASVTTLAVEGRSPDGADDPLFVGQLVVTPDYWKTMEIPIIAGRGFQDADAADAPLAVVVNQTLAERYWPNQDPLGKRLNFGGPADAPWCTVVGVAQNDLHWGLRGQARAEVFVPFRQATQAEMFVIMRTARSDSEALAGAVREAVRRVDPRQPVFGLRAMEHYMKYYLSPWRRYAGVLSAFSVVALILAGVGIYGVMSYMVAQRTREIGIRMALGARMNNVLALVLRHGAILAALGITLGLLGALGAARLLSSLLFGVTPADPPTLTAVSLLVAAVAMLACYIPGRRAARVDPMIALRY